MTEHILLERAGGIARVTFNRPERKNALSADMLARMDDIATELRADPTTRVVILSGGPSAFSAGADRNDAQLFGGSIPADEQLRLAEIGPAAVAAWEALPQITIAAIERFAIGGALTFAMACDFRVLGNDAFVSVPEVALGFPYGMGSIPRLVRFVGTARAKRIMLFAERITAAPALEWGLVDYLAEDGDVDIFAKGLAERLLAMPPLAVGMTKRAANAAVGIGGEPTAHADMAEILLCLRAMQDNLK